MNVYYGPEVSTENTFMKIYKSRKRRGVKIPRQMVKRVMEGNHNRCISLTCAVKPGRLWAANIVGRKISLGWAKFAKEKSFVDGDLLLFKYNGRTRFHVEIYSERSNTENAKGRGNERKSRTDSGNNNYASASAAGTSQTKFGNTHGAAASGNFCRCITSTITADKIEKSRMYLQKEFCTANGLHKFAGQTISMVAEDGTSYPVKLQTEPFAAGPRLRLGSGLRDFFKANDILTNDEITLELQMDNMSTPRLKVLSKVICIV